MSHLSMMTCRTIVSAALLVIAPLAHTADDAVNRLLAFSSEIKTFTANFEQTLYDADENPLQESSGTVTLKRPGRFVWNYAAPVSQQIVADGERLWIFDKELDQVTVSSLDERVSGTPLVMLMGTTPLDEEFTMTALGEADGVDWVELVAKENSTDFESLFVGLNDAGLAAMELRDNFGQATQILFSEFKADVVVDDALFVFNVPDGVDVIGEGGN